jgi:molecular chaperone GrpE (heat shock protein)
VVADKAFSEKEEKEEGSLSKDDIARIKALFNEQEEDIKNLAKNETLLKDNLKNLEKQLEDKAHEIARHEKEMVLVRVEYTKQVHENEETVRRYRKIIEEEKVFAITKFAKDLLEVRDNLRFSLENTDMEAVDSQTDL